MSLTPALNFSFFFFGKKFAHKKEKFKAGAPFLPLSAMKDDDYDYLFKGEWADGRWDGPARALAVVAAAGKRGWGGGSLPALCGDRASSPRGPFSLGWFEK